MEKLGQWLQSSREARGISLPEAEQATKVRSRLLAALEEGNYPALPSRFYIQGMVRNYASYLGLDVAQALRLLEEELGPEAPYRIRDVARPVGKQTVLTGRMIVVVLALAGATALFLLLQQEYTRFIQTAAIATPSPISARIVQVAGAPTSVPTETPTPTPSPTPTPIQEITIEARITDRSWLRVVVDEKPAYEGILPAGTVQAWTAKDKILVRAGNAGGVEISFNGKRQGLMGSRGEVVEKLWTRP